jgi:hypothetical protein
MASFFNNWTAHEIIGPLNKREVRSALLDHGFERKCFRTWDLIEEVVLNSTDEVKEILYQAGLTKNRVEEQERRASLKRKRESMMMQRNIRRRLGDFNFVIDFF